MELMNLCQRRIKQMIEIRGLQGHMRVELAKISNEQVC